MSTVVTLSFGNPGAAAGDGGRGGQGGVEWKQASLCLHFFKQQAQRAVTSPAPLTPARPQAGF